jgi:hypothetical protein
METENDPSPSVNPVINQGFKLKLSLLIPPSLQGEKGVAEPEDNTDAGLILESLVV